MYNLQTLEAHSTQTQQVRLTEDSRPNLELSSNTPLLQFIMALRDHTTKTRNVLSIL